MPVLSEEAEDKEEEEKSKMRDVSWDNIQKSKDGEEK